MANNVITDLIKEMGGAAEVGRTMLEAMGKGDDTTPVQQEAASEKGTQTGWIAFGTVVACQDGDNKAGRIMVRSDAFPDGPQPCDYVSPIGGAGYGMFAVPGIGATVLIGQTPFSDPPNQNFWFGCLYAPGQKQYPTQRSQPYIGEDAAQLVKHEISDTGAQDDTPIVSCGVPNEDEIYQDNGLPDSFVLKHPGGHTLMMTKKNTSERQVDQIKLKSAGNKRLLLDDSNDWIKLIDENKNHITISSDVTGKQDAIEVEAKRNIDITSKQGGIDNLIQGGKDDFTITNNGKGDISLDATKGDITLNAKKSITLKVGNSSIKISSNSITISTINLNINGTNGDVVVAGTSLDKHVHGPGRPTTTPPIP